MKWSVMEKSHSIAGDFSTTLRFARNDDCEYGPQVAADN